MSARLLTPTGRVIVRIEMGGGGYWLTGGEHRSAWHRSVWPVPGRQHPGNPATRPGNTRQPGNQGSRRKRDRTSATCDRPARAPRYRRAARRRGRGTRAAHAHFRVAWPQGRSAQARRRVARRVRARGPTPRPRARSTCPAASACSRAAPARAALLPRVRTEARWSRVRRVHDIVNVCGCATVCAPPRPRPLLYTQSTALHRLFTVLRVYALRVYRARLSRARRQASALKSLTCVSKRGADTSNNRLPLYKYFLFAHDRGSRGYHARAHKVVMSHVLCQVGCWPPTLCSQTPGRSKGGPNHL